MTVGEIKKAAAAYLQKSPEDFVKNSVDLLLIALNNARKNAEMLHDFNSQRVVAQITVDPTNGGSLNDAVLKGTMTPVRLKEYTTFYLIVENDPVNGNGDMPLYHHAKKNVAVWTKERNYNARGRWFNQDVRYPDDAALRVLRAGPMEVYLHGDKVFITPTQEQSRKLAIDGVAWMDEYTSESDATSDWMTEQGSEYLIWAAVIECNYLNAVFTPGLDGNLSPPEKAKQRALETLIAWDTWQVPSGRQPNGIR